MTTWRSPRLPAGVLGLTHPTVLISSWELTARVSSPRRHGFRNIETPDDWPRLRRAPGVIAYMDRYEGLLISHRPDLDDDRPPEWDDLTSSERVHWHLRAKWWLPLGRSLEYEDPFWNNALTNRQFIMATADLAHYWALTREGREPLFAEAFPGGSWAALIEVSPTRT